MLGNEDTAGSIRRPNRERRKLARDSHAFNRGEKTFRTLFPEFVKSEEEIAKELSRLQKKQNKKNGKNKDDPNNSESLLSLIGWLGVFALIIYAVYRFLINPVA